MPGEHDDGETLSCISVEVIVFYSDVWSLIIRAALSVMKSIQSPVLALRQIIRQIKTCDGNSAQEVGNEVALKEN